MMLNSRKINDTQYLNDITLPNGLPKITSTPVNSLRNNPNSRRGSLLLSPTRSRLGTPRRYSLSETNSPSSHNSKGSQAGNSPGPLLSSMNYKDNVSMYLETKSSGLARRIVLYNETAEQVKQPTHQEKYGSPGLFPIVHLFKEKPPVLTPKKVQIKLSSPEFMRSQSPQQASKLLESIGKPRFQHRHSLSSMSLNTDEKSAKSVLDALKEISRKRIHSNEDYDIDLESGKRLRTEMPNGSASTSSKRNRANSPQLDSTDSPPLRQSKKKMCIYDEFAASKSSTDFSFLNKTEPLKLKRKTISTSTESLKEPKHVKLVNVETQTIVEAPESRTKSVATSASDDQDSKLSKKKESPIKVFDDTPLDRIRKNRLAALMGNLAGKEAAILPKGGETSDTNEENMPKEPQTVPVEVVKPPTTSEAPQKPLVSILSPLTSTQPPKQVHFTLPNTISSALGQSPVTQTSASIVAPIVSASLSKSPISTVSTEPVGVALPASSAAPSLPPPTFSFGSNTENKSNSTVVSSSAPTPTFGPPKSFEAPKTSAGSPPKPGGFKFYLKTPTSAAAAIESPASKAELPKSSYLSGPLFSSAAETSSTAVPTFSFTKVTEKESPKPAFSFGSPATTVTATTASTAPTFSFGAAGVQKSQSTTFNFVGSTSTATTVQAVITTTSTITTAPSFGFTATPKLGTTSAFVIPKTTSTFGTPTTTSTFGTATSSAFGSPAPTFGTPVATTSTAASTTASFTFGAKSAPTFGTSAANTSSSSVFGNPSRTSTAPAQTSLFVSTSASTAAPFGSKTVPSSTSVFGGAAPASTFGSGSFVFGASTAPSTGASVFGSAPVTTTTSSVFGATSTSSFAAPPKSTAFGGATPTFGTPSSAPKPVVFGTPTIQNSSFGGTPTFVVATPPTFALPVLGPDYRPSFTPTTTSVFGSNIPTPSYAFGGGPRAQAPGFGAPAATTSSSTFGSSSTSFTGFGGAASAPTFGQGENKTTGAGFAFGASTGENKTFGSGSSTFGKPANSQGGFAAAPSSTFASSTSNTFGAPQSNGGFNFNSGASSSPAPSAPFAFGAAAPNVEAPKPTFNFSGGASNPPPAFGASFGGPAPPFGAPAPQFGAVGTPTFNIGAGSTSTTGRARTQLRARRRT